MENVKSASPESTKTKWTDAPRAFITLYFSLFGAHEFAISLAGRHLQLPVVLWTLVFAVILTCLVTMIGGRKVV